MAGKVYRLRLEREGRGESLPLLHESYWGYMARWCGHRVLLAHDRDFMKCVKPEVPRQPKVLRQTKAVTKVRTPVTFRSAYRRPMQCPAWPSFVRRPAVPLFCI